MTVKVSKIALIGCGAIATSHIRMIRGLKPEASVYLCDLDRRRAESLASRWSVQGIYSDFDELLHLAGPEVVHIVTPPRSHAALAEKAIMSGCHVLVEKPITESAEDYRRLSELAKAQDRLLMCDYSTLGMPVVIKAMREIRSGELGRIIAVHCDFAGSERDGVIPYKDRNHWAYRLKGGILQNMIDHPASLILNMMDPIRDHHIFYAGRSTLPNNCPDLIHVSVRNENQVGSFTLSMGHGCNERRAHVLLEGGTIVIDMGRQLYSRTRGSGPQSFVKKALSGMSAGNSFVGGTLSNIVCTLTGKLDRNPGIANVVNNFYGVVESNAELLVTHRTMSATVELLEKIWAEIHYRPEIELQAVES